MRALAAERVRFTPPREFFQPEVWFPETFTDLVSPYTRSAGNLKAKVMVVLQDWASSEALCKGWHPELPALGHDPTRPTNIRLRILVRKHLKLEFKDLYGTNLFPFIKPGPMSASIDRTIMVAAARRFFLQEVQIVEPTLILALGRRTASVMTEVLNGSVYRDRIVRLPHPAARIVAERMQTAWKEQLQGRMA